MQSSKLVVASLSCAELGTAQPQLVSILVVMAIVAVLNILAVITIIAVMAITAVISALAEMVILV